jgi:hypothetical protein
VRFSAFWLTSQFAGTSFDSAWHSEPTTGQTDWRWIAALARRSRSSAEGSVAKEEYS